jgi:hypothetical protein
MTSENVSVTLNNIINTIKNTYFTAIGFQIQTLRRKFKKDRKKTCDNRFNDLAVTGKMYFKGRKDRNKKRVFVEVGREMCISFGVSFQLKSVV